MSTMIPLLFLAGSPGPLELLVIFAVVLVLFGPRKLPEIARSIGRMLHELRKASDDFRSQIMSIEDTAEKFIDDEIRTSEDVEQTVDSPDENQSDDTQADVDETGSSA